MKKIVFDFWLINILVSIALFVIFRIVISETVHSDGGFLKTVLQILDILLNLAYSFAYLLAVASCSFAIFLNLIDKIRNNIYLSLATFIAIPLIYIVFITTIILKDNLLHTVTIFRNLLIFATLYTLISTVEFIRFRKRIMKWTKTTTSQSSIS